MRRRGFLGRILAIAAAPIVAKEAADRITFRGVEVVADELEVTESYVGPCFSDIGSMLKEVYPPGSFEEAVNAPSTWRKALKR